jgi:hypothetical protein
VSLRAAPPRPGATAKFNLRLAGLMLACALALAVSSLIFKVFALRDEFWPTTFWMFAGEALFGAALLAVASYREEFIDLLRRNPGAVLSINAANELINLAGGLGTRCALVLAPLSLVQAIGSTTTLFDVRNRGRAFGVLSGARPRESVATGVAAERPRRRAGSGRRGAGDALKRACAAASHRHRLHVSSWPGPV